ncbi:MAG: SEC-C metal-binding domain-containing protein [Pirellulaceae bacterium]
MPTKTECEPSDREDRDTQAAVRELLAILPADVLGDIRSCGIDARDPAFLDGLMDHASRLSLADPRNGRRILGKIIRLRKLLHRNLRESDPEAAVTGTIVRDEKRVGRNDVCPCGSGRKFKQCCIRKALQDN